MSDQATSVTNWHTLSLEEATQQLQVNPSQGLSSTEAAQRLQQYGPNLLTEKKKEPYVFLRSPLSSISNLKYVFTMMLWQAKCANVGNG